MGRLKICVSDRCFFPKSAFMSSKSVVKLAKSLGYEQVEFHPTWAVWFEVLIRGRLNCQPDGISSFHISWREDGSYFGRGFFERISFPAYHLFPPEPLGTKTLQKLEKKYKKPVVIHWPEDFARFKSPLLELQWPLKMNLRQVEKTIQKGDIKGVVIDTYKLASWAKDRREKEDMALKKLFPYIGEAHFRFRHQEDVQPLSGRKETKSVRVMRKLAKMGYKGRVVVEMGWPDPGSIEVLHQEGLKRVHQKIVKFLKKF